MKDTRIFECFNDTENPHFLKLLSKDKQKLLISKAEFCIQNNTGNVKKAQIIIKSLK